MLEAQNSAYINSTNLKEEVKIASENLRIAQEKELRFIESEINEQMVRFNDFIYDETRKAPVIDLDNGKRYEFYTPDDTGTGTSFKSLIIFDLSILKLTPLPAIAHDSLIFKNIGDAPIDKIMELYMQSKNRFSSLLIKMVLTLKKQGLYLTKQPYCILMKAAMNYLVALGTKRCDPRRLIMYISYNKLWKLLIDKNMNKQDLKKLSGVSSASIAKLGKGENITTDVLVKICKALDCDITDIMELIHEEKK